MMNTKRLVAVGRNDKIVCDPSFEDSWSVGVDNAVDALPEVPIHPDYPRLPLVDFEAEVNDLISGREDEEFNRRGC